ncbi:Pentatricopeptide repeat-containing protein [Vitis vinifera]|uniref:Pentatricopeptide repeat-containing protein n=1 Tax=Vitis vinifera TaxID=29760 RepID=A0A438G802_VITVI|nr:Pentatricopeptide repeat-containing protein [Vitis vinifera]
MPERNVISWNSMLATYMQRGYWEEGLKVYIQMLREGVKTDWITFSTSISVCADLAVLILGNQILAQAEKLGYAQNGQGRKVIEIFEKMLNMGNVPDQINYLPCSIHQLALKASSIDSSIKCRLGDSEANCSSLSVSNNLSSLANLYDGLGNLLLVPLSQQVMVQQSSQKWVTELIKRVRRATLTVFEYLLAFISGPKVHPKTKGWSLVSRLMHSKHIASEEEAESKGI